MVTTPILRQITRGRGHLGADTQILLREQLGLIGWQKSHCAAEQLGPSGNLQCGTRQNLSLRMPGKAMHEVCHWRRSTMKLRGKAAGCCRLHAPHWAMEKLPVLQQAAKSSTPDLGRKIPFS